MKNHSRLLIAVLTSCFVSQASANAYDVAGVVDDKGKIIVPIQYRYIKSLGHGYFFLEKMDAQNPLKLSYDGCVVNNDGQPIPVAIPSGLTLSKVYLLNVKEEKFEASSLPRGTIFQVHGENGFGLSHVGGKIILEPMYKQIGDPNAGFFQVFQESTPGRDVLAFTLNSSTGKRVSAPPGIDDKAKYGFVDHSGKIVEYPKEQEPADRIIKYVRNEHFSAMAWKEPEPNHISEGLNRIDQFADFLHDYDLIGMPLEQLKSLLGTPERRPSSNCFYYLAYPACFSGYTGVEMEIQDKKVTRWREAGALSGAECNGSWVTTNVLFDPKNLPNREHPEPLLRLFPKGKVALTGLDESD